MSDDGVGVRKRGCMARCDAAADRAHMYTDYKLERWGLVYRQRLLVFHMLDQLSGGLLDVGFASARGGAAGGRRRGRTRRRAGGVGE